MNCLLCLEINENYQNLIIFNSSEWLELNIQHIIEKHFWKVENVNSQSYICQSCWQKLHSFHEFYLQVEKARATLNTVINEETISKDIETENKEEACTSFGDTKNDSQLEPEVLFLQEVENTLEIFEKEDEEEINFKRSSKRIRSTKKHETNKINVAKNRSRKIDNKEKSNNEIYELECKEKKSVQMDNKLERINIDNFAEEKQIKPDKNLEAVVTESKLDETENGTQESKIEENPDDKNCKFENNNSTSSHAHDTSKLDQLWDEDDKFIAEHFQITCTICQTPLDTYAIMLKHYRDEHNQRGYASCCSRKFYPRVELIDHIKLHLNPEYFKCKYCNKILTRRAKLKYHIKIVHEESNIECEICGKILFKSKLKRHMKSHETVDDKKVPCKECGKTYFSKPALEKHIKVVHLKRNYQICDLCGKSILKSSFKRHMCEHEGKPPPTVSCEICGRNLSDLPCLKRHMRLNHPPKGVTSEFKCTECEKVYKNHASLKSHIRTVHESKYARKCTLCGKTFKGPAPLKEHMSRHVGQPLRACSFCPKVFYSNGNMYAHRKREHPIEWEKSIREKYFGSVPEKGDIKRTEDPTLAFTD